MPRSEAVITSTLSTPLQRLVQTTLPVRTDDCIVKAQTEAPKALDDFLNSYVFADTPIHPFSTTSAPLSVVRSFLDLAADIERPLSGPSEASGQTKAELATLRHMTGVKQPVRIRNW